MRRKTIIGVPLLAVLAAPALGAQVGQPSTPKFPITFDFNDPQQRWANQSPIDEHSVSEWTRTRGRTGGGIHMKGNGGPADQMRVWRRVIPGPPAGKQLHVRAWAKGAAVENVVALAVQAHAPKSAYLAGFASTQVDQPLRGDFDWTELKTTIDVPRGAANLQVMLMLVGNGEVWFDDVDIQLGGEATLIVPGVFEVRSEFTVSSLDAEVTSATLLMPLPLAYRDQAPLAYSLKVEPDERRAGERVYEDAPGNWVVELRLKGVTTTPDTRVSWSSVVLAAPTDFTGVPAAAPMPEQWPEEATPWLRATRSAQSDHERVRAVAAEIKGASRDVMEIIAATIERVREIYASQEGRCTGLDAVQALTRQGSCTSRANLVTALLRANGIPARILAGYPAWSGPLQTHSIIEAYVPGYGWYPIESSLLRAPWPSHQQINVSIVTPANEDRSSYRGAAAGGVPYLSLTEHVPTHAPIRTLGTLGEPESWCDHECRPIRNFAEATTPEMWERMKKAATTRWASWLQSTPEKPSLTGLHDRSPDWYSSAPEDEVIRFILRD